MLDTMDYLTISRPLSNSYNFILDIFSISLMDGDIDCKVRPQHLGGTFAPHVLSRKLSRVRIRVCCEYHRKSKENICISQAAAHSWKGRARSRVGSLVLPQSAAAAVGQDANSDVQILNYLVLAGHNCAVQN